MRWKQICLEQFIILPTPPDQVNDANLIAAIGKTISTAYTIHSIYWLSARSGNGPRQKFSITAISTAAGFFRVRSKKKERNNFIAFGSFFHATQKESIGSVWHKKKHLGQKVKVILINFHARQRAVCADMENKSSLCARRKRPGRPADNAHTLI